MAISIFLFYPVAIVFFLSSLVSARFYPALPQSYRPTCSGPLPAFMVSASIDLMDQDLTELCAGPAPPNLRCACYIDGSGDDRLACRPARRYEEPLLAEFIAPYCESRCSCGQPAVDSTGDLYQSFRQRQDRKTRQRRASMWLQREIMDRIRTGIGRTSAYLESLVMLTAQPRVDDGCIVTERPSCQTSTDCRAYCGQLVCVWGDEIDDSIRHGECMALADLPDQTVDKINGRGAGIGKRKSPERWKRDTMYDPSKLIGSSCQCHQTGSDPSCCAT
jgi:hypothetical protein